VRLILASASPRRAALLTAAGFQFETRPVEVDERPLAGERPTDYVLRIARAKARAAVRPDPEEAVLAADTAVVIDDLILGKPTDEADAVRMLSLLSGREHQVLTGVVIHKGAREASAVEVSLVQFLHLSRREIASYVASGEPWDKAGAYAVQGLASRFVSRVTGSCSNVVGLPVARVYRLLEELSGSPASWPPAAVEDRRSD